MTLDNITTKQKVLSIALLLIILVIIGLWWLAILMLCLTVIKKLLNSIQWIQNNVYLSLICYLICIFSLAIITRLFILEIYRVPSASMEDSIFIGDDILVSKLNYGPKLPQSPFDIPWVNILLTNSKIKNDSFFWRYYRLSGFSRIKRGDVIVFSKTKSDKKILVKRCIGLPGESVKIHFGNILINNLQITPFPTFKQHYRGMLLNRSLFIKMADSLKIDYFIDVRTDRNSVECYLNTSEKSHFLKTGCFKSLVYLSSTHQAYLLGGKVGFSVDNFGPIVVPKKGLAIALNARNYLLYKSVLKEEGAILNTSDSIFLTNSKRALYYTFKHNYYFLLGDNSSISIDSRYWGFVSETMIQGKAIYCIFSKDKANKFKLLKTL